MHSKSMLPLQKATSFYIDFKTHDGYQDVYVTGMAKGLKICVGGVVIGGHNLSLLVEIGFS